MTLYFKPFSFEKENTKRKETVDIGIDFGNNALKVSYKIGDGDILDYSPPIQELNAYNRKSTVFVSFDFKRETIDELIEDKEYYEFNGEKILELDPSNLELSFDFSERVQNPNQLFRCIKSQYYEGVFNKNSEFFNKIAEKSNELGELYRYFLLGKVKDVNLMINSNLLFDKLYCLSVETVLKDVANNLDEVDELDIRIIASIPLGASPQLLNDDEKVENCLKRKFCVIKFRRKENDFEEIVSTLVSDPKAVGDDIFDVNCEIRFKTQYELVAPLLNTIHNDRNANDKFLLIVHDIGSLTSQIGFFCVDKKNKLLKQFGLESFYAGGLNFDEKIIVEYCKLTNLDPSEYFWEHLSNCFENLKKLEHLKKQILYNNFFLCKGVVFEGKDNNIHEINENNFETLKELIFKHYPDYVTNNVKPIIKERIKKHIEEGGSVKVVLSGESFNQRSNHFNGKDLFLDDLEFNMLKYETWNVSHTNKVNFISKTFVRSMNFSNLNFTLYDNIAVVSSYKKNRYMILGSSKVGEEKEFLINPIEDNNGDEYILLFTYVKHYKRKIDAMDVLDDKKNTCSVFHSLKDKITGDPILSGWEENKG